ncbi:MAG TPA: alpha/beta fold hydrolase [Aeromicrobium sp.]|nr:alpha/beta fold hydrolase [Aeromicrobium sp.]HKY56983.1 alpha/beta fold hydrolase [Aeromicrobium sp.]
MTFETIGRATTRASRATGNAARIAFAHGLRMLADQATPNIPVPPHAGAVDLPGRGTTHVLDLPGPTPDAPVVLLMHGIATTGSLTWFTVLEDLQRNYRVVTFDQRWHGRGIRSAEFLLQDCADDAVAVLDALGIDQAVVVGYSMGGATAQLLWNRHPERVAGLVLCSTSALWEGHIGERVFFRTLSVASKGLISVAADRVQMHADSVPPPSDEIAEAGLRAWAMSELRATSLWSLPIVMAELGRFNATDWIGGITVPTGVLVTSHDKAIPTARQLQLADAIPGAIMRFAPGGHTSLVFDLKHWKPVFLDLVDDVVRRVAVDSAA